MCMDLKNKLDQLEDFGDCRSFYETGKCSLLCLQKLEAIQQRNLSLWHTCSSNCWSQAFVQFSETLRSICREQHGFRFTSKSSWQFSRFSSFCKRMCLLIIIFYLLTFALNKLIHQEFLFSWRQHRTIEGLRSIKRGSRRHLCSLLRKQGSCIRASSKMSEV
ncbi:hypothetical protein GAYE_SCF27MG4693 [Galdieria yellowstonensis]|uniref:Transmembrane protein n=1 Tax=Galdieria yellowstonensis TaxID=3028027 RepID=A0AAV9IHV6_9RHOD|nr:hypothetical protein GAYE_SCF27MG4693 [Galdieria yellowstonensis]